MSVSITLSSSKLTPFGIVESFVLLLSAKYAPVPSSFIVPKPLSLIPLVFVTTKLNVSGPSSVVSCSGEIATLTSNFPFESKLTFPEE